MRLPFCVVRPGHGTIDSHPAGTAAREDVCTALHRPVDPERELARPRVVNERVLHDVAEIGHDVGRRIRRDDRPLDPRADGVPGRHAIELAIDDMPRDVVRDAGDVEQAHAVRRGGFEDDVRLIQIECPALAAHHQLGIDEEVDPASPITSEIDVGSTPLDEREPRVLRLHSGDSSPKRPRG